MIRFLFLSGLLACLTGGFLSAVDLPAFARALEAEGDYYRAIGVWKELRFGSASEDERARYSQAIVADLWRASQNDLGLAELAAHPETPGAAEWKGLFEYRLSRFAAAEVTWESAPGLYRGLLLARTGRGEAAAALWEGLGLPDPTARPADQRSPLTAAALSVVVPGLGQAYAGHWFDGAQAAAFVTFFGGATWMAWQSEQTAKRGYLWTSVGAGITLIFEAANLYGAWKTAEYFNQSRQQKQYAAWEQAVYRHPASVTAASSGGAPSGPP